MQVTLAGLGRAGYFIVCPCEGRRICRSPCLPFLHCDRGWTADERASWLR